MPVRMLNEFAYCPRLVFQEWIQGEFVDNEFTVEGRFAHRRVESRSGGPGGLQARQTAAERARRA